MPLGSITKTDRTVKGMPLASTLVSSSASSMSYRVATCSKQNAAVNQTSTETSRGGAKERGPTFLSWSPMIGKPTLACEISSMSLTQSLCDEMSSADRPMTVNQTAKEGHGPRKPPVSKPAKRRDEESMDEGPG